MNFLKKDMNRTVLCFLIIFRRKDKKIKSLQFYLHGFLRFDAPPLIFDLRCESVNETALPQ